MKKNERLLNIGILAISIGIIAVLIMKFALAKKPSGFSIKDPANISVLDLKGNRVTLSNLFDSEKGTYCLIFELTNCNTCIVKGINDLIQLNGVGERCIAIVINDLPEEVIGWSQFQEFSSFYVLKKIDFFNHIQSALLPVFFKIKAGEIEMFRFITP